MAAKKQVLQAEVNVGLIGHVDHGKSSIAKALTGIMTDTHSEELKRGISIRLGYADAVFRKCPKCKGAEAYSAQEKCPNCKSKTEAVRRVSFVDAPGHETLMTTTLSGAALMQGAVLVIAANEKCPQPRTVEHLMAAELSGVKDVVVAQNKIDLVDKKRAVESFEEIKAFLKEHGYGGAPVIPVAANFGTNIDLLIEAIVKTIKPPKFDLKKPLKLYVARSFDVNKPGTLPEKLKGGVVGGSILQGKIKVGDKIEIGPGLEGKKLVTEVVSLSTAFGQLKEAMPGGLIAIGSKLDPGLTKNDQMRGQVVGKVGSLPEPVESLSLEIHPFERLVAGREKIKVNDQLILTVGTSTSLGTVLKIKDKVIEIVLKVPVVIEKKQRVAISKKTETGWRLNAFGVNL